MLKMHVTFFLQVYELKRAIAILVRCLTEENPKEKEEEPGMVSGIPKVKFHYSYGKWI